MQAINGKDVPASVTDARVISKAGADLEGILGKAWAIINQLMEYAPILSKIIEFSEVFKGASKPIFW